MAFSAFRLMMGAVQSSGPVVLTDTITTEVACLVQNQTHGSGGNPEYSINTMAATYDGTNNHIRVYSKVKNGTSEWVTWQPTIKFIGPV